MSNKSVNKIVKSKGSLNKKKDKPSKENRNRFADFGDDEIDKPVIEEWETREPDLSSIIDDGWHRMIIEDPVKEKDKEVPKKRCINTLIPRSDNSALNPQLEGVSGKCINGSKGTTSEEYSNYSGGKGINTEGISGKGYHSGGKGINTEGSRGKGKGYHSGGKGINTEGTNGKGNYLGGKGINTEWTSGKGNYLGGKGINTERSRGKGKGGKGPQYVGKGGKGNQSEGKGDKGYVSNNFELRPGDWMCTECGKHVFARYNRNCFHCNSPKPIVEVVIEQFVQEPNPKEKKSFIAKVSVVDNFPSIGKVVNTNKSSCWNTPSDLKAKVLEVAEFKELPPKPKPIVAFKVEDDYDDEDDDEYYEDDEEYYDDHI